MKLKNERETVKFLNASVTKVVPHCDKQKILVAGYNGKVSCFTIFPLQQVQSFNIFNQYCTSMTLFADGVLVGSSVGELVYMKFSGQIVMRKKISDDCISSILESETYVVTTGYDGIVNYLKKSDLEVEKTIQLGVPLWNSIHFENSIYVAGNPSFQINSTTFQIKKLKRFDSFAIFNNKLYGSSDERGLTCLKNNSNSYIPCNFILSLQNRMMIFSEECATEIMHDHQMEWRCHRIKQIKKGSSITCGFALGNIIILGDNCGVLYRLQYEIEDVRRSLVLGKNSSENFDQ